MPNHNSIQTQRTVGQKYQKSNGFSETNAVVSSSYFERNTTTPSNYTLFDGTATTANILNGDTIYCLYIKKNSRIRGGRIEWEALGASVTLSVGTSTTSATSLMAATSAASAGGADFANTIALLRGTLTTADQWLTVTVGGANPALASKISGFFEVLKD
jgi:hypothetical protein